jgi:REP element-mobilizing transposase RayT
MRTSRVKVVGESAVYHCISRVVAGERLLDEGAKEVLRKMVWKTAAFCGVEVLAYCVMSNHFHVLVRVPPLDGDEPLSRAEVLRRYRAFYGEIPGSPDYPSAEVLAGKFVDGGVEAERWETRLRARMGDVSEYMKLLKQRFTIWFNKTHRRFGTLWSERFKSVLVENSAFALKTVAAYIDLNPVRAGLVEDPAAYRWCSYAEAVAGNRTVSAHYGQITGAFAEGAEEAASLASYRLVLFGKGGVTRRADQGRVPERLMASVLVRQGAISPSELLRRRVRYFSDGAILGSREFVQRQAVRCGLRPPKGAPESESRSRKMLGAVPMQTGEGMALTTWRRLRKSAIQEEVTLVATSEASSSGSVN